MLRKHYRFVWIAISCALVLGNTVIYAQHDDRICKTKTGYFDQDLAFSPDSKYLAASWDEANGIARVWNTETREVVHTLFSNNGTLGVGRYTFSSDSRYLLAGSIIVTLWDLKTEKKLYQVLPDSEPSGEAPPQIIVSSDDKYFLRTSNLGTRLYSFKTGELLHLFKVSTFQLATFSQDGRYILMQGGDKDSANGMVLWDIQANKLVHTFGGQHITYASFVDNDRYIATIDPNEPVEYTLWSTSTFKQVLTADIGDGNGPLDVQFSANGKFLISQNTLWDSLKGQPISPFTGYAQAFVPDNRYLLTAHRLSDGSEHTIFRLWDIKLNKEKPDFFIERHFGPIGISPNGKYLAAGDGNALHLWDISTGRELYLKC